ncbi:hypothetical protein IQ268_16640 [Oculatella sp. LEGE 06141]|uniref:hypothetical protein n=1 Tax=Oculatella sp. LEGE 06141 TaxID=1828648 RepID=UPI00187E2C50|nr:hypothetical protein [Oculatella sp. LEGE 06141]MBE9180192.1 hypothetical protein [Oculatella sp. LEGE 06141]
MSQQEPKNEEQLSDEQLEDVSGGLTDRFTDSHRDNLNKGLKPEEELSDEQLQGVSGGLTDRFDDAHRDNLNK